MAAANVPNYHDMGHSIQLHYELSKVEGSIQRLTKRVAKHASLKTLLAERHFVANELKGRIQALELRFPNVKLPTFNNVIKFFNNRVEIVVQYGRKICDDEVDEFSSRSLEFLVPDAFDISKMVRQYPAGVGLFKVTETCSGEFRSRNNPMRMEVVKYGPNNYQTFLLNKGNIAISTLYEKDRASRQWRSFTEDASDFFVQSERRQARFAKAGMKTNYNALSIIKVGRELEQRRKTGLLGDAQAARLKVMPHAITPLQEQLFSDYVRFFFGFRSALEEGYQLQEGALRPEFSPEKLLVSVVGGQKSYDNLPIVVGNLDKLDISKIKYPFTKFIDLKTWSDNPDEAEVKVLSEFADEEMPVYIDKDLLCTGLIAKASDNFFQLCMFKRDSHEPDFWLTYTRNPGKDWECIKLDAKEFIFRVRKVVKITDKDVPLQDVVSDFHDLAMVAKLVSMVRSYFDDGLERMFETEEETSQQRSALISHQIAGIIMSYY